MPAKQSPEERWKQVQAALGGWKIALAILVGIVTTIFAPYDFFEDISSDVITLFGIVMAALVPAMLLAATSMRAGGFSVASVRLLAKSLDDQMVLFGLLFLCALGGAALVIVGKSLDWSLPAIPLPTAEPAVINLSGLWNLLIATVLTFLALRLVDAVAGIRDILRLSSEIAVGEAFERSRAQSKREDQVG